MSDEQALKHIAARLELSAVMPSTEFAEALRRLNAVYARRVNWRDTPAPEPELARA